MYIKINNQFVKKVPHMYNQNKLLNKYREKIYTPLKKIMNKIDMTRNITVQEIIRVLSLSQSVQI